MLVKLVNILLIVVLSPNNCLFFNRSPSSIAIVRSGSQLAVMTVFLGLSLRVQPFMAALSNASDRVSRIAYVIIALLGLLVALDIPGVTILGGVVATLVEVVSYSFSGYFAVIAT